MGNKVNPIALRIGQQVNWSNWWDIKRGNNSNTHREELTNYLIINNVVESVLKKNNIFVSDLIVMPIKHKTLNALHIHTDTYISTYECWNVNFSYGSHYTYGNITNNYISNVSNETDNVDYLIEGLVFNSKTLGKSSSLTREKTSIYSKYIDRVIESGRKSIESTNLLKESYILIERILKDWLNKDVRIELKEISGSIFNAKILSSWVEKSMWEDKFGANDKRIIGILKDKQGGNTEW